MPTEETFGVSTSHVVADVLKHRTNGTAGFYGTTPIVQRSGAAQATSLVGTASSADVTSNMKAALIEVMNTLAALGLWKGSA
jgi:hypothetical protein